MSVVIHSKYAIGLITIKVKLQYLERSLIKACHERVSTAFVDQLLESNISFRKMDYVIKSIVSVIEIIWWLFDDIYLTVFSRNYWSDIIWKYTYIYLLLKYSFIYWIKILRFCQITSKRFSFLEKWISNISFLYFVYIDSQFLYEYLIFTSDSMNISMRLINYFELEIMNCLLEIINYRLTNRIFLKKKYIYISIFVILELRMSIEIYLFETLIVELKSWRSW